MGGSTHFCMLEMFSVHNEIGTYHFREIGEGRGRGCRADRSRFHRIIWREVAFHFIGNPMLHSMIMTLIAQVCPLPTTPVFSTLTERFVAHSDKRCPVSKSFFTHPSKCYSSSFSITWPFLSAPAQFHLSAVAHLSRIRAPTSRILERSGISFGAVSPPFFRAHGWLFIRIYRVLSRGRRRIAFKYGYGTHFSHLPNIAFRCSYVLCWYLSMF